MSRPLPDNLNMLLLDCTMAIETSLVMVKQYQQDVCNHLPQSAISREELVVCTVCTICIKAITSSLMLQAVS